MERFYRDRLPKSEWFMNGGRSPLWGAGSLLWSQQRALHAFTCQALTKQFEWFSRQKFSILKFWIFMMISMFDLEKKSVDQQFLIFLKENFSTAKVFPRAAHCSERYSFLICLCNGVSCLANRRDITELWSLPSHLFTVCVFEQNKITITNYYNIPVPFINYVSIAFETFLAEVLRREQ